MSAMNLSLQDMHACLPGSQVLGDAAIKVVRVHTDSRSLQPGDLFVALHGEHFDAADFLPEAASRGAAAVLCARASAARLQASGLPGVLVEDARLALGQLAAYWRQRWGKKHLIAVTGSNGKTTVTQMLASILRAWKPDAMLATQGNFNNDIGVPLTLLRLRPEHEVAVLELGMNHPGEIAHLAAMVRPSVAVVNNAQREHQEFMVSVEAVARENGMVFKFLSQDGVAVFPLTDAFDALWREQAGQRAIWRFSGQSDQVEVCLRQCHWHSPEQLTGFWQLRVASPAGLLDFDLHVPGQHNVSNALAAVACALAAGVAPDAVQRGLSAFRPMAGRSQIFHLRIGGRKLTLIDDTYNANPDSVRALIDMLAHMPGPRLLVLGDMGEVGQQGAAFHAEVGRYARERGIEHMLVMGDQAIHAAMAFGGRHFECMDALQSAVQAHLNLCASVAVKGSRFMHMERVVQALQAGSSTSKEVRDAV